jgi:hypothetical protein
VPRFAANFTQQHHVIDVEVFSPDADRVYLSAEASKRTA